MPSTPKKILWTARREPDGIAFDFRLITPKDHEFVLSRKEHFADHDANATEDDLALAAYGQLRGAIERSVDEIDGDPTTKTIELDKKGQPTGVDKHDGDEHPTIEALQAELADRDAKVAAVAEQVAALGDRLTELTAAIAVLTADARAAAGLTDADDEGEASTDNAPNDE